MEYIAKAKSFIANKKFGDAIKILDRHVRENPEAAHLLFSIYNNESSGEYFDKKKAFAVIEVLNKEDYIPGKFDYALMHFKGDGVEKDVIKAEQVFRKIANTSKKELQQKYSRYIFDSCEYVGTIYENGLIGDTDKVEALKNYRMAAKSDRMLNAKYKVGKLIVEVYPDKYHEALTYLQEASAKNHVKSKRLLTKIYLKLMRAELQSLVKLDSGSVDPQIILDKLERIDENIL